MSHVTEPLFSAEAEQAVIGGLFVSPVTLDDLAGIVSARDFAKPLHRKIFAEMEAMAKEGQPIDILTVPERMESRGVLDDGDWVAMGVMARDTPSAANVTAYAALVRSYSQRRDLMALADQLAQWARHERDAGKVMAQARAALDALESGAALTGPKPLRDLLPPVLDTLDDRANRTQALLGLATGLPGLDHLLDGLCAGRLYVVAGRPGSGKSVFGLQIIRSALVAAQRALLFSLEMPAEEVIHRLLAAEIPLPLDRLQAARLADGDWALLADTTQRIADNPLWIDDSSQLTISDIQARTRRLHRMAPLGLVVVDYLGLVDGDRPDQVNRVQEISAITRGLKRLAKELHIPVVALSQLNRTLEQRADKRPILSDLRESGSIEQDADVVAFTYRDELHNPDTPDKNCAELIIRKHRAGKIGMIPLRFDGEHCRFQPLAGPLPSRAQPQETPTASRGFRRRGGDA